LALARIAITSLCCIIDLVPQAVLTQVRRFELGLKSPAASHAAYLELLVTPRGPSCDADVELAALSNAMRDACTTS